MKNTIRIFSVVLLTLFLAACGNEPPEEPEPAGDTLGEAVETDAAADAMQPEMENGVQTVHITAGANGYDPESIQLQAGVPARLVFTRTTDSACLEQVQIPAMDIQNTDLPMNQPVEIEFTPEEGGEFNFVCGMDMQRGTIVVKA